jgi:hypothetical protein
MDGLSASQLAVIDALGLEAVEAKRNANQNRNLKTAWCRLKTPSPCDRPWQKSKKSPARSRGEGFSRRSN